MREIRLSILFLFLTAPAWAVPSITSVTGTFSQGSTMTIAGSGFGESVSTHATTQDDFESNAFNPAWADTFSLKVVNNNENRHSYSTYYSTKEFTDAASKAGKIQMATAVSDKWKVEFWVKLSTNWDWGTTDFCGDHKMLSNIKIVRMWNPGSTTQSVYLQYSGVDNQIILIPENVGDTTRYFGGQIRTAWPLGQWVKLEWWYQENSTYSAANGKSIFAFNGSTMSYLTNIITRSNNTNALPDNNKRPYLFGFENEWAGPSVGNAAQCPPTGGLPDSQSWDPNDYSMDDAVVLKGGWAAVYASTCTEFFACSVRETQEIKTRSDGSITFVAKVNALDTSQPIYFHYLDDNWNLSNSMQASANSPTLSIQGVTITGPIRITQ